MKKLFYFDFFPEFLLSVCGEHNNKHFYRRNFGKGQCPMIFFVFLFLVLTSLAGPHCSLREGRLTYPKLKRWTGGGEKNNFFSHVHMSKLLMSQEGPGHIQRIEAL